MEDMKLNDNEPAEELRKLVDKSEEEELELADEQLDAIAGGYDPKGISLDPLRW